VIQSGHTFSNEPGIYIEDKVCLVAKLWIFLMLIKCRWEYVWKIAFTLAPRANQFS
jgi:hypothetical protein